jgi:hypothetical protein
MRCCGGTLDIFHFDRNALTEYNMVLLEVLLLGQCTRQKRRPFIQLIDLAQSYTIEREHILLIGSGTKSITVLHMISFLHEYSWPRVLCDIQLQTRQQVLARNWLYMKRFRAETEKGPGK